MYRRDQSVYEGQIPVNEMNKKSGTTRFFRFQLQNALPAVDVLQFDDCRLMLQRRDNFIDKVVCLELQAGGIDAWVAGKIRFA